MAQPESVHGAAAAEPAQAPAPPEPAQVPEGSAPSSRSAGDRPTMRDLKPMNEEIVALVAANEGRDLGDLVPEVEAVMRRYGAPEPNREGILQWIEEARASVRSRAAGS